jgi:hypothetical protein
MHMATDIFGLVRRHILDHNLEYYEIFRVRCGESNRGGLREAHTISSGDHMRQ